MKKIINLVILCILLTGCSKKMICTSINTSEEMDIKETTNIYYKLNKIEKIDTTVIYNIKDDAIKNGFNNIFKTIKEKYTDKYINTEETIDDNTYTLKITYDPKKLSDKTLKEINSNIKLNEYKKNLENQKMICE